MTVAGSRTARQRRLDQAIAALASQQATGVFDEEYPARPWIELLTSLDRHGIDPPSQTTDAPLRSWVRSVTREGGRRVAAQNKRLAHMRGLRLTPFQQVWQHTYAAVDRGLCVPDLLAVDRHLWGEGPMLSTISLGLNGPTGSSLGLYSLGEDFPRIGVRAALGWLAVQGEVPADIQGGLGPTGLPAARVSPVAAQALALRQVMRAWDRAGLVEIGWLAHAAGLSPGEVLAAAPAPQDLLGMAVLRGTLAFVPT